MDLFHLHHGQPHGRLCRASLRARSAPLVLQQSLRRYLRRWTLSEDRSTGEDNHEVGELVGELELVRDEQDGAAQPLARQVDESLPH